MSPSFQTPILMNFGLVLNMRGMDEVMLTTHFLIRAVVAPDLGEKFDHWYSADHLPWALDVFKCNKARLR